MTDRSDKRIAVVTGASRAEGMGFEICRELAQAGKTVVLTARDEDKARALAECLAN